jgi:hypothetical protein
MKGVPGLLIALGLGIVGAFCNWMYLAQLGRDMQSIDFIGVSDTGNVKINAGDKFNEGHFMKISIPGTAVGNLDKAAYQWKDLAAVVGAAATKSYSPGEILLRQDVRTPPEMDIKKLLSPDERVIWIPVDTRTFVPALVNAGDNVSFIVPRTGGAFPTPVPEDPGAAAAAAAHLPATTETIGPFRILALGNRLGSQEVLRAAGMSPSQENVMAVAVKFDKGEFDAKGQKLLDTLRLTNFQQVQVILHPSPEAAKK